MLKKLKILYAEDEELSRENLHELLEMFCDNVYTVEDGKEALKLYQEIKPDIVISDIEMPFLNGLQLAEKIREKDKKTQIIITTAYTDKEYMLKAVELNLIKYLVKPVKLDELTNTLKKAVENINAMEVKEYTLFNNYTYNVLDKVLKNEENEEIHLTYNEMSLLELLLKNANNVVPYEQIESYIWEYGYNNISSDALRTLIRDLRRKISKDSIKNISKMGYKIVLSHIVHD